MTQLPSTPLPKARRARESTSFLDVAGEIRDHPDHSIKIVSTVTARIFKSPLSFTAASIIA